jgi:hypothetical protein
MLAEPVPAEQRNAGQSVRAEVSLLGTASRTART